VDFLRAECKDDFFFFVDTVLNPVCPKNNFGVRAFDYSGARHFKQMYRLLTAEPYFDLWDYGIYSLATKNPRHNKKLCVVPRIHGKTTMITVAYTMWRLYKNPNLRVLIVNEIRENACDMLSMIKNLYVNIANSKDSANPVPYLIMGGSWIGDLWNEDRIKVKPRTNPDKTPSISTAGLFTETTSQHFDIVMGDDLEGKENTQTIDQIDKTQKRITALTEIGDYNQNMETMFIFPCTIWNYADWYCKIIDEMKEFYDILKLKCWNDKKEPLFPEKFTTELLEKIKAEKMLVDPMEWYAQYENDPMPPQTSMFTQEMFQYYDPDKVPKDSIIVISGDLALSKNIWSDESAFVPVAIGGDNKRYVLPYWHGKEDNPNIIANELIEMAKRWQLRGLVAIGVEEGIIYNSLYPILMEKAPWVTGLLRPLKINNRSKDSRVFGLQPLMSNKMVYFQKNMFDLQEQLMRFGKSRRRDLADAFAYHLDLMPYYNTTPEIVEEVEVSRFKKFVDKREIEQEEGEIDKKNNKITLVLP